MHSGPTKRSELFLITFIIIDQKVRGQGVSTMQFSSLPFQSCYLFMSGGAPRRLSTWRANGNSCVCPDFMSINVINIYPAQRHPQCDQYLAGKVGSSLGWWEGMQYFPWDGGGLGRSYVSQGGFKYLICLYLWLNLLSVKWTSPAIQEERLEIPQVDGPDPSWCDPMGPPSVRSQSCSSANIWINHDGRLRLIL